MKVSKYFSQYGHIISVCVMMCGVFLVNCIADMVLMKCDLFSGKWIPDEKGSRYTNTSCLTIPDAKNCFKHGRTDEDFLKWRWKPESCDLPRFDSKVFLEMFRGSKMAFVGDSVAKNQMDSLLCLLSSVSLGFSLSLLH